MFPKKLHRKLQNRKATNSFRQLETPTSIIDFSSNDYLGFSKNKIIFEEAHQCLKIQKTLENGATGSRLLSGNHQLYNVVEAYICDFYLAESALIFNSGYTANLGFFASVPQREDVVLYDEHIHASIRDGVQLSNAKPYKFKHNNLDDLEQKIIRVKKQFKSTVFEIYVVTESVFSMDGDSPDLKLMVKLCKKHKVYLIVDEAHSLGVFGENGKGLVQQLKLEKDVFARIITFGKALGCHGSVILGSEQLIQYLINFARSFIYTTGLPPHALATIKIAHQQLGISSEIKKLQKNIHFFQQQIKEKKMQRYFFNSTSAIQCCVISGTEKVKLIAQQLHQKGFGVKAILSPTVPIGKERLRFCLHSYNTKQQITEVLQLLATFVK